VSKKKKKTIRLGVGGPVGSGKTTLVEQLAIRLTDRGMRLGIISNDVVSKEDALRLHTTLCDEMKIIPHDLVVGVQTGGCPHTAVREDPSVNVDVLQKMEASHPELDLILLEGGGDNITITFSPAVADFFIYVIDVAGGEKYPRKNGLGIIQSDFLVINKKDLAQHVGADLSVMERDAREIRKGKPFVFTNCKTGEGLEQLEGLIMKNVLLM
jgi:urease accessory protein